jgi:hypothetical protein
MIMQLKTTQYIVLWHLFFRTIMNLKENFMKQKHKNLGNQSVNRSGREESIGNKQETAQTGGQNAGGRNRDREDDQYTDDLRKSGNRNSSNTKSGS